ncbi:MAG: thiosulfate oxidation carrier protein SoxY [Hyphomicrobium sp.]|nr:thiosulfate oxidation carrier protein SoxY [Hyphomicrobium sp.]
MSADPTTPAEPHSAVTISDRRDFVLGGAAAAALVLLLQSTPRAAAGEAPEVAAPVAAPSPAEPVSRIPISSGLAHSVQFEQALQDILVDAEPVVGEPMTLELPDLAENGNVVPYSLIVESPMTDTDYVRMLYLLSTANPQALVAKFQLIPANGKATVSGRMRLAKTQDVVGIAEISTGQMVVAVRKVEVTIGGCGNE